MATLVLSAVGTLVGGPLGGAVGALVGRQVDAQIFGSPKREGPRLQELAVSTSSYGQPIPRVHGTIRAPGSIIWATDLNETRETSGGKGKPKTTTYSYSVSFAVALSSRPVTGISRIWADGNLLRGAAGDLKVGGAMRLHTGRGDQPVDPLIAAAEGGTCPAFRHCAYVVFEDLALADFGNRIPALSFEIIGDAGEVSLVDLLAPAKPQANVVRPLPGLEGYAMDGGSVSRSLSVIEQVYPLACDSSAASLRFFDPEGSGTIHALPAAAAAWEDTDFGGASGRRRARQPREAETPQALRYYDPARDYQPGIQRAVGPTQLAGQNVVEFPGVLAADRAKDLTESLSQRVRWNRDRMAWRMAELDPAIQPGSLVSAPGHAGTWRVTGWEWRERGVELELVRQRTGASRTGGGDSGVAGLPLDLPSGTTLLDYFELPWNGSGSAGDRQVYAAVSSTAASGGAALYAVEGSELVPLTTVARANAVCGSLLAPLGASPAMRFEAAQSLDVTFASPDPGLRNVNAEALLRGANRLLVGSEVVQFAQAESLGSSDWRLHGLLRGRGGTEAHALAGHPLGETVVLLDDRLAEIGPGQLTATPPAMIAAIGLGDETPAYAALRNAESSIAPLSPVHPHGTMGPGGDMSWCWIRRSRGSWAWPDTVDVPLVEESEAYLVGVGPVSAPLRSWQVTEPRLELSASEYSTLLSDTAGQPVWVRQVGSHALSPPLLLCELP